MDENTIFKGLQNQPPTEPISPQPGGSVSGLQANPQFQSQAAIVPPSPPPQAPTAVATPPPEDLNSPKKGIGFKKIMALLIGLIVVGLIAFAIYSIIPKFQTGKNQKVTLEYWGLWEDSRVMSSTISDFERANPNITVNYTKQDPNQYREKLTSRINNGTGPDIFRYHNTWPVMLSSYLLPLPTDTISPADFKNWFYPVAQQDLVKNGAIYGIPLEIDTIALYINTDLFKDAGVNPPENWEDFPNVAAALTVKDSSGKIKTAGAALGTSNNITHAPDIMSILFAQNGVDLKNIQSNPVNLSQALQYYTSYAQGDGQIWDKNQDSSILAFSKGNLAMYFGYSWDYFTIKALNPNLNFKIVRVPKLAGRDLTIASYWVEGVSVKSKHQKEALLFMKYLAQKETEQKLYSEESKTRLFGEPYARVDLADTLKDNQAVYPFVAQAPNATSTYFVDSTYDKGLNDDLDSYLNTAIDSILNNTSPDSAADTLSKGFVQVLQQYGK